MDLDPVLSLFLGGHGGGLRVRRSPTDLSSAPRTCASDSPTVLTSYFLRQMKRTRSNIEIFQKTLDQHTQYIDLLKKLVSDRTATALTDIRE